jgi:nucleoside-diphosphate-sugar epimerase
MSRNPLSDDLDAIVRVVSPHWESLRGKTIFITGGTGFIGTWLLESFTWANDALGLNAHATVLTRNPTAFRRKAPHLADHASISLLEGSVTSFHDEADARFDLVIHGAAESSTRLNEERPLEMIDAVVDGTRRVLDFAVERGARRLLFLSSGAVYGRQPRTLERMPEDYNGGPDVSRPRSAYAEAKRLAELLCHCVAREQPLEVMIARCFAFVGPYLPLDVHFAAGNFIRDGLAGGPIRVNGDGSPRRTYLYAADLASWLWTILLRCAPSGVYNVGSESEVSIRELAHAVQAQFEPMPEVRIAKAETPGAPPERYTPSTVRARDELGLRESVPLDEALRKTIAWHRNLRV